MNLETGHILDDKYRIVRVLGKGGMGSVYEGENTRIHRRVAIKVLHAHVASNSEVVLRFEREAQAAGRIGSEHIVEVLDLGHLPSGERYMVMEYLEGESLGERLKKRRRLAPQIIAPLIHQLLAGLDGAHAAEIVHRDLKPDNIFLLASRGGQRDFVKVLDFGVSKFNALERESGATRTSSVLGTPFYMSPEQAKGGEVDKRSDLYAVGVILYQCVTGRLPHQGGTFDELAFKIALEPPEPAELVVPGLDPAFAAIVRKAMGREPTERFQSAGEFQRALGNWMMTSALAPGSDLTASSAGLLPVSADDLLAQSGSKPNTFPGSDSVGSLSGSHHGLAVTPQRARGAGPMIAIGLAGALLFLGGTFVAYKLTRPTSAAIAAQPAIPTQLAAAPAPASPPAPSATAAVETATAAGETTTADETAAAAETATAVETVTTEAPGTATPQPANTAAVPPTPPTAGQKPIAAVPATSPAKPATTSAKPAAKPTGAPGPAGGRVIGSEL
jgi:serine/threonine-protein kinase